MPRRPARPSESRRLERLRRVDGWFDEGARLRAEARRARRCVECARPLPSARSPYCSNRCQYRHHGHYFWDAARIVVLRRDRYTCLNCGVRGRRFGLEVDHIVELARGGAPLAYSNLQTLCRRCHRAKTAGFLTAPRARDGPTAGPTPAPDSEWFPA